MASKSTPLRTPRPLRSSSSSSRFRHKTCPICLTKLSRCELGKLGSCDHFFCLPCIQAWAQNVNTCPIDRKPFNDIEVYSHARDIVLRKIHVPTRRFEDVLVDPNDVTYCEICHRSNNENVLLLCDGCDKGYHMYCLTPPLSSVPEGTWYCQDCLCLVATMNMKMAQEESSDSELSCDMTSESDKEEEEVVEEEEEEVVIVEVREEEEEGEKEEELEEEEEEEKVQIKEQERVIETIIIDDDNDDDDDDEEVKDYLKQKDDFEQRKMKEVKYTSPFRGRKRPKRIIVSEDEEDDDDFDTSKYLPRNLGFSSSSFAKETTLKPSAKQVHVHVQENKEGTKKRKTVRNEANSVQVDGHLTLNQEKSEPSIDPLPSHNTKQDIPHYGYTHPRFIRKHERQMNFDSGSFESVTVTESDLRTEIIKIYSRTPTPDRESEKEEKIRESGVVMGREEIEEAKEIKELSERQKVKERVDIKRREEMKQKEDMKLREEIKRREEVNEKEMQVISSQKKNPPPWLSAQGCIQLNSGFLISRNPRPHVSNYPGPQKRPRSIGSSCPSLRHSSTSHDPSSQSSNIDEGKRTKRRKSHPDTRSLNPESSPRARTAAKVNTIRQAFRGAVIASHKHDESAVGFQAAQDWLAKSVGSGGRGLSASPFSGLKHNVALPSQNTLKVTNKVKRNLTLLMNKQQACLYPPVKKRCQIIPQIPSCSMKTDYVGPIEDSLDMLESNEVIFRRDGSIQPASDPNSANNSPKKDKRKSNNEIHNTEAPLKDSEDLPVPITIAVIPLPVDHPTSFPHNPKSASSPLPLTDSPHKLKGKSASTEKKKKSSESGKGSSGTETEKLESVQVKVKAITSIGKKESRISPVALSPQITNLTEKDKGSSTASKKTLSVKQTKFVADSSSGANRKKLTSSSPVETRSAYRKKVASPAVSSSTACGGGKKLATGRKKQASATEPKKKLLDISKRKPPTSTEKKQTLATAAAATDRSLGSATANSLMRIKRRSRRFINSIDATREHCTSETIIGMVFCSNALASCTTQQDHQSNNNNNNNNNSIVGIITKKEENDAKNKIKLASTESDSHELSSTKTVSTRSSSGHHGPYSMHLNADEAIKTIIKLLQENYITGDINVAQMEAIKDKAINKVKMSGDSTVPCWKVYRLVSYYVNKSADEKKS
ncbi:PREDICTED: uncharacterized protein LOC105312320 [Amphimedon queenslandica]|uniref:PHD and RING finger domain-containing protein 1 n=1 Tax=Amphimedon queenslandica TaxID=400682 RepID=A0AAN0IKL3_AMPQE|nr:PREDICTED: uncharacterized protein LOC105312320 [Amphimedon queenslandica]|eukprot:XP_011403168.2 PREDICTED: uncharacterized protein LOC105312320 [Amphimedon queenslandica]